MVLVDAPLSVSAHVRIPYRQDGLQLAPTGPLSDVDLGLILHAEDRSMSDLLTRLNTALEGRYAIEREPGEGGVATVNLAAPEARAQGRPQSPEARVG